MGGAQAGRARDGKPSWKIAHRTTGDVPAATLFPHILEATDEDQDASMSVSALGLITAAPKDTSTPVVFTDDLVCGECDLLVDATSLPQALDGSTSVPLSLQHEAHHPFHFTCGICFSPRWSDATASFALPCCHTRYCAQCWSAIARAMIEAGEVNLQRMRCPTPGCTPGYSSENVATLLGCLSRCAIDLTPDERRQLQTLLRLHRDPAARLCPRCSNHVTSERAHNHPHGYFNLACLASQGGCGHEFCSVHGDLHPASESCAAFQRRTCKVEPARANFARRYHTRICPSCACPIIKDGGCDRMLCKCGHHFLWSSATVEVPCRCLNFRTAGRLVPWGAPPCRGAARQAHAKLFAWRCGFFILAAPILVPLGAISLSLAVPVMSYHAVASSNSLLLRRSFGARARGLRPGSFEYNFVVHGDGRRRPFRRHGQRT
jgi:hypothetical protein